MKKRSILAFAVALGCMAMSSCSKEPKLEDSNHALTKKADNEWRAGGRVYAKGDDGRLFVKDYYMREFIQTDLFVGCANYTGSCLPDVILGIQVDADHPSGTTIQNPASLEASVHSEYSDDLIAAVNTGHNAVKSWYNAKGKNLFHFPSQAEIDLMDDKITIKAFDMPDGGTQYLVVNKNATDGTDIGEYAWPDGSPE